MSLVPRLRVCGFGSAHEMPLDDEYWVGALVYGEVPNPVAYPGGVRVKKVIARP